MFVIEGYLANKNKLFLYRKEYQKFGRLTSQPTAVRQRLENGAKTKKWQSYQ